MDSLKPRDPAQCASRTDVSRASIISYLSKVSTTSKAPTADATNGSQANGAAAATTTKPARYKPFNGRNGRYYGRPLEDRYAEDGTTFVVIAKKFGHAQVHRFNKEKSLYLFGQHSPVRRFALYVTTNQYFEIFVLLTIVVNCVFLALSNPPEEPEYVFAAIYTAEMFLKIIAKGFALHKFAYLREAWNWLDFVVVIFGYVALAPAGVANLSGMRTFRVFRALRTISAVKGLKTMVNTLLVSMKMLWDVMILALFFICLAALIGMQVFVGVLRNKCVRDAPGGATGDPQYTSNSSFWELDDQAEPLVCGNGSRAFSCSVNYTCLPDVGPNPNFGYTSFDHFGWAILASFQLVTLDFWENVYNNVIYALGPWCVLYFIAVIFFGRFYLVNLVLAVVTASYENEVNASKKDTEEARLREKRTASSYSLRRRESVMSLVYGQQDVVLDSALQKALYDSTAPESRESLAMSRVESLAVFQVRSTNAGLAGAAQSNGVADGQAPPAEDKPPQVRCPRRVVASCQAFFKGKYWKNFRARVSKLTEYSTFDFCIIFFILLNTLFMALEHHEMDKDLQKAVNIVNLVCTLIFLIEMLLKLIALSPSGYVKSKWNIFDGVVVLISIVDLALTLNQTTNTPGTSVLRTFRLLRVLKLAKSWTTMASLLVTIGRTLGALVNLTVILAIVIYIFAVLGMQVLGSSYTPDKFGGEVPRWNFTDFWHSTMLVVRVLCGEWIEPLWDGMRAAGPVAIIIFVPAFILAHFIILNLFLALLLSSFAGESARRTPGSPGILKSLRKVVNSSRFVSRLKAKRQVNPGTAENGHDSVSSPEPRSIEEAVSVETRPDSRVTLCCCELDVSKYHVTGCFQLTSRAPASGAQARWSSPPGAARGLWLCVRFKTKCLVEHKYFEFFILVLIAGSSIALTFEDVYLDSRPTLKEVLYYLNIFFAVSFTLEFLLKLVGLGVVSYFTNAWNLLDFLIVIVSLVALFADDTVASIRSLRTLRALRPLRAISRFEGMKVVISSLFHAIPGIGNVLLVCLVFWLIFSIMGVHLFGGKFYKCVDGLGHKFHHSVVANKTSCLQRGGAWVNSNVNFDDAINGFLALLQVATFEGWMEVMEDAVDATQVDSQPIRENNMAAYAYFVTFIVSGSFFILNLFIGVIIDNFNQLKQQMEDCGSTEIFLTPSQRQWMSALKNASTKKPKKKIARPKNKLQAHVFDFVQSWKFEFFVLTVISINMVAMMVHHYGQSDRLVFVLDTLNVVFTAIFVVEVTLRIIAFRGAYFKQAWNVFDLIIVILSFIGIVVDVLQSDMFVTPSLLRTLRVFRVARLLRLPQNAKGIRRLVFSLVVSLPALFNIGALLFLFIFIYSIVGMSFFGYVKYNGALNEVVNFNTFLNSMMLLFRVMTAAGWNDVLDSLMIQPPHCDPDFKDLPYGNCGNKWIAIVFFCSYIIVVFLILINMYVAVILENYNQVMEQEKIGLTSADLDLFYQKWQQYDPEATQYIRYCYLSDFVGSLEGNLCIPKPNKAACALLSIPLVEGDKIHCLDLLHALVRRVVSGYEELGSAEGFSIVMSRMEERLKAAFPSRNQYKQTTNTLDRNRQEIAARVIQRAIMNYRERKLKEREEMKENSRMNALSKESENNNGEETTEVEVLRAEGETVRESCDVMAEENEVVQLPSRLPEVTVIRSANTDDTQTNAGATEEQETILLPSRPQGKGEPSGMTRTKPDSLPPPLATTSAWMDPPS